MSYDINWFGVLLYITNILPQNSTPCFVDQYYFGFPLSGMVDVRNTGSPTELLMYKERVDRS